METIFCIKNTDLIEIADSLSKIEQQPMFSIYGLVSNRSATSVDIYIVFIPVSIVAKRFQQHYNCNARGANSMESLKLKLAVIVNDFIENTSISNE